MPEAIFDFQRENTDVRTAAEFNVRGNAVRQRISVAGLLAFAALALGPGMEAAAQIYDVRHLNTVQIAELDRERTVVILPGGIIEEHGPYLPTWSDGYMNERLTRDLADAIVARGWTALVFPIVPLGAHGAEIIGRQYDFPGSFTLRASTLRTVFMDLADELGERGFRHVFIVHLHGGPEHNRALDEAGDYFRDTHGGNMVHLAGIMPVFMALGGTETPEQQEEEGFSVHGSLGEHSVNLFLAPDRVSPDLEDAPTVRAADPAGLVELARREDWPGYFGAPRLASAAQGAEIWANFSEAAVGTALRILDGLDPAELPRYADLISQDPVIAEINRDALAEDAERRERQTEWLRSQGLQD